MLNWSESELDVKGVLNEFHLDSGHVRWLPHQKNPVLTEEVAECAFLFPIQVEPDIQPLGGVGGVDLNLLCILAG